MATASVKSEGVADSVARSRPQTGGAAVTPSNSTDLSPWATKLWIGGAGTLIVYGYDSATVTFAGVPAGTLLEFSCRRVIATGTTATSIVALYDVTPTP